MHILVQRMISTCTILKIKAYLILFRLANSDQTAIMSFKHHNTLASSIIEANDNTLAKK